MHTFLAVENGASTDPGATSRVSRPRRLNDH